MIAGATLVHPDSDYRRKRFAVHNTVREKNMVEIIDPKVSR
jgi:hypothetical protein